MSSFSAYHPNLPPISYWIRDSESDDASDKMIRLLMLRTFYRTQADQILQKTKWTLTPEYIYYCHPSYVEDLVKILKFHQINIPEPSAEEE